MQGNGLQEYYCVHMANLKNVDTPQILRHKAYIQTALSTMKREHTH